MKIAKFHFELEDGSPLVLSYKLQDNSLTPKWIDIVNRRKLENVSKDSLELKIQNKIQDDLPNLLEKLNNIIFEINKYYDKQLPLFVSTDELDHQILNYLHEEFELYGERHAAMSNHYMDPRPDMDPNVWPGIGFKKEFHQLWLDLNQWIHITESAIEEIDWPNFSCLVQYLPFEEKGAKIEEVDKLFLNHSPNWGQLYLGYNTLGKDYMHAYGDNDQRVIINNQVKIQEYLSSEVWLNFSQNINNAGKKFELNFYNWWKTLGIPFIDINKLSLGRYYLGEIIIDNTFLNIHPVHEDWLVPDSDLRRDWNLKVFRKIVAATGIEIVNE
jgi:hypothetical protein